MTLVLASQCIDGVIIVADRKITALGTLRFLRYDEKLKGVIRNVIFGYAGSEGGYQIFVRYVVGDLVILRDDLEHYTYQNMIQKLCKIMDLIREFRRNPFLLDVVVARQFPMNGPSDLFLVRMDGNHQQISKWKAVGEGDPIASKIVRKFWNREMKMKDFAELGFCIIKYVEEEGLEPSVGVGDKRPSIKYLKDGGEIDTEPEPNEFSDFENAYNSYKNKFKEILDSASS
jgi:20S proteasome alpha/beta subunit